jgi:putative two-component system response regulator
MPVNPKHINTERPSILIVDDMPANLELLSTILSKQGYETRLAPGGKLGLMAAKADPPDLILLDVNMPEMNGFEVCKNLKADTVLKDIPVIFLTGVIEAADRIKAFSVGAVDYVTKPFQLQEICARIETHLRLRRLQIETEKHRNRLEILVQEKIREISCSQMATIFALATLAESRDGETGHHLERVQNLCRILANEMRRTSRYGSIITEHFIENLYQAAPLHDIGKVGISDAILLKSGKLSSEEKGKVSLHAKLGAETLRSVLAEYPGNSYIAMGLEIAHSHHEKYDGTGYPEGLIGEAIPLSARIVAVADVYDSLRSSRPYKSAMPHSEAEKIIIEGRGTQFDPEVVDAFISQACEFEAAYTRQQDN